MSTSPACPEDMTGAVQYRQLTTRLGQELSDAALEHALTHRSYAYENGGLPTNERLEFLGDAVLGLVVTDRLFADHPDLPEGQLAKMRAAVVNMRALASVARALGLGQFLLLGKGEESTGGRDKSSILADTMEAIFGAVYLSHGIEKTRVCILRHVTTLLNDAQRLGAGLDWKTSLQELSAELGLGVPEYAIEEEGPDHSKIFHATVRLGDISHASGTGRTKKEAEQEAAASTWKALRDTQEAATTLAQAAAIDPAVTGGAIIANARRPPA